MEKFHLHAHLLIAVYLFSNLVKKFPSMFKPLGNFRMPIDCTCKQFVGNLPNSPRIVLKINRSTASFPSLS